MWDLKHDVIQVQNEIKFFLKCDHENEDAKVYFQTCAPICALTIKMFPTQKSYRVQIASKVSRQILMSNDWKGTTSKGIKKIENSLT